jgi:hypothetical protein
MQAYGLFREQWSPSLAGVSLAGVAGGRRDAGGRGPGGYRAGPWPDWLSRARYSL